MNRALGSPAGHSGNDAQASAKIIQQTMRPEKRPAANRTIRRRRPLGKTLLVTKAAAQGPMKNARRSGKAPRKPPPYRKDCDNPSAIPATNRIVATDARATSNLQPSKYLPRMSHHSSRIL